MLEFKRQRFRLESGRGNENSRKIDAISGALFDGNSNVLTINAKKVSVAFHRL